MEIEPGDVDDAPAVVEQWVALAADQQRFDSHVGADRNRATIREEVVRHAVTDGLLVARDAGVIGFVMFTLEQSSFWRDATRGVVENLYVVPDYRDEGVGSALLAAAEDSLRERGADVVTLEAMARNEAARRFYRRHGYEPHRIAYEKRVRNDNHSKDET